MKLQLVPPERDIGVEWRRGGQWGPSRLIGWATYSTNSVLCVWVTGQALVWGHLWAVPLSTPQGPSPRGLSLGQLPEASPSPGATGTPPPPSSHCHAVAPRPQSRPSPPDTGDI